MNKELRILMLEDLEEDAGLVDRVLVKEKIPYTRKRVETKEEFLNGLLSFEPDIILSDHTLPQFNSIEALRITQEHRPRTPFIIVTGSVSEEFAVSCIKRGANDYVLKSNLSRLPLAIRYAIHDQASRKKQEEQESELRKQNQELVKMNSELDSFVYNISHNLRSPLVSVIGLVNVALSEENSQSAGRYFEMIKKSTLKLDDSLKEILDYSQNLRRAIEVTVLDIQQICENILYKTIPEKDLAGIEIQLEIQKVPAFHSDRARVEMIVRHLLSNCVKYKDQRKPKQILRIKAEITSALAALTIWDNGIGIKQDQLPKAFDMFVRSNEHSDGAGLGLFVVKEVVAKLEGTIELTSAYGEWTQAKVILPNKG